MAAKRSTPPTIAGMARRHGISRQTLHDWRNHGIDITDDAAIRARKRLIDTAAKAPLPQASHADLLNARVVRARIAAAREKLRLDHEAGRVVDTEVVGAWLEQLAVVLRAQLSAMVRTLPERLSGIDAAEAHAVLFEAVEGVFATMRTAKIPSEKT